MIFYTGDPLGNTPPLIWLKLLLRKEFLALWRIFSGVIVPTQKPWGAWAQRCSVLPVAAFRHAPTHLGVSSLSSWCTFTSTYIFS